MISIGIAGVTLLFLAWLIRKRIVAAIAASLLLFSLSSRLVDILYLDLAGPIYATQLDRHVGANSATPFFCFAVLALVLPLAVAFGDRAFLRGISHKAYAASGYINGMRWLMIAGASGLIALLYLEMLRIGTIPLLSGMDRVDYNIIASPLHRLSYEMNFLISATLGIAAVIPRLQGRSVSVSANLLVLLLLVYWALTGNRFSAFLMVASFYAFPFGALILAKRAGLLTRQTVSDPWSALISPKVLMAIGGLIGAIAVVGLIVNSYYNVRGYADPVFELSQRLLVQPVEIYASHYQNFVFGGMREPDWQAIDEVLINPIDSNVNTSIKYLMINEVGFFRTEELLANGTQFAGGYPEIYLSLFGMFWAIPLMVLIGICTAWITRLAMRNIFRGYLLSSIMAIYVMFAFHLGYIGGMLNSLLAYTFYLKILILFGVFHLEQAILRRERENLVGRMQAVNARSASSTGFDLPRTQDGLAATAG